MEKDPELAQQIRLRSADDLGKIAGTTLPTDLELRSLRRARALLGWQRWLFGPGIAFIAITFSMEFSFEGSRFKGSHFLIRDFPTPFASSAGLGIACWIGYYLLRITYDDLVGVASGATGNPSILVYSTRMAPTERPDIGYAMIFPSMTIVKVIAVQIVGLLDAAGG